jgi:ubiquitin-like modifier-activating enzyme ATG7
MADVTLRFSAFETCVDTSFWLSLASLKLDVLKLDESPRPIRGFLAPTRSDVPNPLRLTAESLDLASNGSLSSSRPGACVVPGTLLLFNTAEAFEGADRAAVMRQAARELEACVSASDSPEPALLCPFLLLCHADLKNMLFRYWIAFPALSFATPCLLAQPEADEASQLASKARLLPACTAWLHSRPGEAAWLLTEEGGQIAAHPLEELCSLASSAGLTLAFIDPCVTSGHPGWPARNLLVHAAALLVPLGVTSLPLLCVRAAVQALTPDSCLLVTAGLPSSAALKLDDQGAPLAVGWERDADGRLLPRSADVRASMDPERRAADALTLNNKLMKWRVAPGLDTELLGSTKCLLVGAGTLGCAVARTLLAYGVMDFCLLDNARVSFSNPARQSLFTFEDCLHGGALKADAAATALKSVFPGSRARGVVMTVPSPGHPPLTGEEDGAWADVLQLEALVSASDVVFLLTDSRESRWLPALLAAKHRKLCVTAALGFDSFLVMRHGCRPPPPMEDKERLACYYCGDVLGVADSTKHRSLDQQCTVSRPGLAPLAGALAAELAISALHHPLGALAPAGATGAMGDCAHSIRGELGTWQQSTHATTAFSQCCCCSDAVLAALDGDEVAQRGFLEAVWRNPASLEELSGLCGLQEEADACGFCSAEEE